MRDFLKRLRQTRDDVDRDRRERAEAEAAEREQERRRRRAVDAAADEIERYITDRLREFQSEFVEFLFDASSDRGRNLRVHWNEPPPSSDPRGHQRLHQLSFIVRRYHEYADVEVAVKPFIANKEQSFRRREEDVYDGDPEKLKSFVDDQIIRFTRDYLKQRQW